MAGTTPRRPDTVMGRALATRALRVAEQHDASVRSRPDEIIDLTVPEMAQIPSQVREAAKDALDRGETHYTVRPGIVELREAIAQRQSHEGYPATADGTVVTNGGSEALYIALQCVVSPDDNVIIAGPAAPNVIQMIEFIGGTSTQLNGDADTGFFPNVEHVAEQPGDVLLVASPSLISGKSLPTDQLAKLLTIARDREMEVILDRSGSGCLYEEVSLVPVSAELGAYPITIGSFSTSYGLGGWRVGYFTAPERLMAKLRNLKQAMSICTTAVSQYAALTAINGPAEWLEDRRASFNRRRAKIAERLVASNVPFVKPDAFPSMLIDTRSISQVDAAVVTELETESVRVDPGSRYGIGTSGFVRIDLGVPEASLMSGIERIVGLHSDRSN